MLISALTVDFLQPGIFPEEAGSLEEFLVLAQQKKRNQELN